MLLKLAAEQIVLESGKKAILFWLYSRIVGDGQTEKESGIVLVGISVKMTLHARWEGFSLCNRELENKFHPFGLLSIKYLSNKLPLTTAMLRLHTILPHVLWSNKAQQIVECHIISDPIYSTNKPFFIKEFRIYSLEHILIPKGIYGIKIIWFPIFSFPIKIIEAFRRKNVVKQI